MAQMAMKWPTLTDVHRAVAEMRATYPGRAFEIHMSRAGFMEIVRDMPMWEAAGAVLETDQPRLLGRRVIFDAEPFTFWVARSD